MCAEMVPKYNGVDLKFERRPGQQTIPALEAGLAPGATRSDLLRSYGIAVRILQYAVRVHGGLVRSATRRYQ